MVSQITKDFQRKSKLRKLADGGSPNPSMLGTGAAARAGGLLAGRSRHIDDAVNAAAGAPAPAPAPQQVAQAPKKSGLRSMFGFADGGSLRPEDITGGTATSIFTPGEMKQFNAMGSEAMASGNAEAAQAVGAGRAEAAQAAAAAAKEAAQFRGFADGGSYLDAGYNANRYQQSQLRDGGRVKGPGGRTDDKVGPVMLSDEEYVLPGDTADAIGRDKLDAIRLATHEFKDERKESALRGRADDVPVDHLADGGAAWTIDSKGTVRPNAFGDAAAGPGYQQPRMPPPQPGTTVGPSAGRSIVAAGPRTVDMGTAEVVEPAAATRAERLGRMAGKATRVGLRAGGGLAVTAPLGGFGDYKADTGGVDTSAGGTLGYLAKGEFGKAGTSLSGGAGEALADSGRGIAKTADWVAGLVGAKPNLTGSYDKMIADKLGGYLSLRNPENKSGAPSAAKPSPVAAATSALRSDQGPALPVQPGSYQSRRLSEMGVPLDVQNSKPVVDSVTGNTRGFLRTGGTNQYQNLGTYGGNGNIYGKAADPSRPGRINNFVGVGAGASPFNEVGNTVQSPATAAATSALRGLGSGSSAPGAPSTGGGGGVYGISGEDRYDKLAKELRGMYSAEGQGNLARRLLELEQIRANEQGNIRTNDTSRANTQLTADTSRGNAELNARASIIGSLSSMEAARDLLDQKAQAAQLKVLQDAQKQSEGRMEDNAKVFESVADTFAAGDKDKQSQYRELLSTLPPELHAAAQGLAPEDKRAFYTNIVRQQLGRNDGLVLGRDVGATAQNAVAGGLIGRMTRFGSGAGGKAVDRALGKTPRVGPVFSALRPVENLSRFGTVLGAAGGAYMTPKVENLTRWDPVARDPETGAALPAREDLREAATYGAFDTYLDPTDDSVQTVSGRRTRKPKPDEEEAYRRFRSALRN